MSFLNLENVKIHYPLPRDGLFSDPRAVKAVDGVSFGLDKGLVLGVVGESGCGKSTLARGIMALEKVSQGQITLMGKDLLGMSPSELKGFRRHFQMVFQDPEASLNPRMTCGEIIGEPLKVYEPSWSKEKRESEVRELMLMVGLNPAMVRRFPHEFSGGQRQRINIARAISIKPQLLVCDESVSALDVSIQAQILQLLEDLKTRLNLTLLFISHDLAVVRYISDQILVMYLGHVMEKGSAEQVIHNPRHPYTKALVSAVPRYKRLDQPVEMEGEIPSPINPPEGCVFSTRCPIAQDRCRREAPTLDEVDNGSLVACFFSDAR